MVFRVSLLFVLLGSSGWLVAVPYCHAGDTFSCPQQGQAVEVVPSGSAASPVMKTISLSGLGKESLTILGGTPLLQDEQQQPAEEGKAEEAAKPAEGEGEAATAENAEAAAKEEAAKEAVVGTVQRSAQTVSPADPAEFQARPDEKGMIEFQFRNQKWPELLEWLAEVSAMSLDWQELPDDTLNISTRRPYSLEEARDLFNRHLLMRGYTLLEFEGMLQVARVKGLNPSLVPRMAAEKLPALPPNRFVRTTFVLDSLLAESVLPELTMLLSKNGTLHALTSTNRLEAMDSACNLAEIFRVLNEEQSEAVRGELAREFPLQHVRAEAAREQLELFLGLRRFSTAGMDPEQAQAMLQQQADQEAARVAAEQAAEQANHAAAVQAAVAAGQPPPPAPAAKRNTAVSILADSRRNCLVVHAPPDRMALIESFLRRIDVPSDVSNLANMTSRWQVYRPTSLDPNKFMNALMEMDALEPGARLSVDEKNKSVIAYASVADHYTIQNLLERMDGSARNFDVIQLRRLKADEVAATVKFLMGVGEEKQEERRYWYYDDEPEDQGNDKFRVAANVRDNQVLIWANELERAEINKLLEKMGEIPNGQGNPARFRTIEASRSPETLEYLQRIKQLWEQGESTPLILPDVREFDLPAQDNRAPGTSAPDPAGNEPEGNEPAGNGPAGTEAAASGAAESEPSSREPTTTAPSSTDQTSGGTAAEGSSGTAPAGDRLPGEAETPDDSAASGASAASMGTGLMSVPSGMQQVGPSDEAVVPARRRPPGSSGAPRDVRISVDARGNLVLQSDDPAALDRLEEMMRQITPPRREFDVFRVEHAPVSWMRLNLVSYFKDREKTKDSSSDFMALIFGDPDLLGKDKDQPGLDSRPPLQFLADADTKTILVRGADDADRETIRQLIELWDVPSPPKEGDVRLTRLIRVRHTRADSVVTIVKEVYRDLLSATDSAFQQRQGGGEEQGGGSGGSGDSPPPPRPFNFAGNISLGVDAGTNTIVISATGRESKQLMDMAAGLIEQLDQASAPASVVQFMPLENGARNAAVRKVMASLLKVEELTANPPDQPAKPENPTPPTDGSAQPSPPESKQPGSGEGMSQTSEQTISFGIR